MELLEVFYTDWDMHGATKTLAIVDNVKDARSIVEAYSGRMPSAYIDWRNIIYQEDKELLQYEAVDVI